MTVISYPIPLYQNLPIDDQFYEPSRFVIDDITFGTTTTVTTTVAHNYVAGQQVRLLVPQIFGSSQLNNSFGYVLSVPTTTSFVISIDSVGTNTFRPTPYTATITNIVIDSAIQITVTANNYFLGGNVLIFSAVSGMTQINTKVGTIISASPTGFTVTISTTGFSAYTSGGTATLLNVPQNQAQVLAIGGISNGQQNSSGRVNNLTYIPGSFINVSPE